MGGFLNDPGRSVYVGELPLNCAALNTASEVRGFRDSEVGELHFAGVAEEHVRGRDVAVNDAGGDSVLVCGVREVERRSERVCDVSPGSSDSPRLRR